MAGAKRREEGLLLEKRGRSIFSLALRLNTTFKGFRGCGGHGSTLSELMESSDSVHSRLIFWMLDCLNLCSKVLLGGASTRWG